MHTQHRRDLRQLSLQIEGIECQYYGDCVAPLCPKDIDHAGKVWFPGEPACRLRRVPDWVLKQRKIARLRSIDPDRYFTLRMLNRIQKVDRSIQGANPDLVTAERRWPVGGLDRTGKGKAEKSEQTPQKDVGTYPLF